MPQKILVLCTGNSCRSQMAESFLRFLAGDRFEVFSAGLEPGVVNPKAIQVMQEVGVDLSSHTSKNVNQFVGQPFDYVITVCDNAKEHCPYFPGKTQRIHWSFIDPAAAQGTEAEILAVFREVRDQIRARITEFLQNR
ncbi:arsenate reductase ArsC [candidate division KSB1 bacterium]|nr:arsenate reductase ArsC [candidate division KSB1 bacterium]